MPQYLGPVPYFNILKNLLNFPFSFLHNENEIKYDIS